ncbi:hypothetical protein BGX29_002701 [Mortierella sp. GBA35]|nr:hypothetical protein BGX23_008522 [Mortierella sp. AD031]KAF9108178.1 hypothetical protein BGX29_002701 [Mortierella sp. GBA35]KAG0219354.1 hypothetical protein BGX33_003284 [Mortierella sp. NVP41]
MRFTFISSAVALVASTMILRDADAQAQACNGYAELCAKPYNEVSFATTHNSYAYTPPGALAANQNNDIPTQLKDGVRAFMLDAYNFPSGATNDIELCHTACTLLDAGPLSKVLGQFRTFMDQNPNEVISIFWENAANLTPARFQTVYQAAGMTPYLYTQTAGSTAWPTLGEMIASKKRLLNFVDSGADASVPWLMAEYDFIFETPYQIASGAEYPCTVDRPKGEEKQMYVMNHFISGQLTVSGQTYDVPQSGAADKTNGPDLASHANKCTQTFSKIPNFVAVDFYEKGSVLQTVAQLNGVTWNGKGATSAPGTKNGATSGQKSSSVLVGGAVSLAAAAVLGLTAF